jgi:17beta-estradiol 17-dehydrogenase / very-long-chain 3-oxoacyl-CoA reductase
MLLIKKIPQKLLYIILIVFFIEIFLLVIKIFKSVYKYFLINELNLVKRYGKNSWVIITGASSGQGRDFALEFAKRGFNILMIGSKRSYNTEKELKYKFPSIQTKVIVKDFRKAFENNFFDDINIIFNNLGARISVLINNVGYRTAWKPYHQMPSELIKDTIAIGTIVQSRLTQMVIPYFLERLDKYKLKSGLINITAQCLHPNFLFGLTLSNEISVPYLSVYEASNAFGFYQGNSIYKEYQNKFDILNITPGAVVTKNTQYLKNTFFSIDSDIFVKNIIKMLGHIQGHTCAYWGHGFSNFLINLGPFMKDKLLDDVGNNIAKHFMLDYQKDREKYKV